MKVDIINSYSEYRLSDELNSLLSGRDAEDIFDIKYSTFYDHKDGFPTYSAMIIYKE